MLMKTLNILACLFINVILIDAYAELIKELHKLKYIYILCIKCRMS